MKVPFRVVGVVAFALGVLGCASEIQPAGEVEVCRDGRCASPALSLAEEDLIEDLFLLFKENEGSNIKICEAESDKKTCKQDAISFFVMGGPIPGRSAIDSAHISSVSLDRGTSTIRYMAEYQADFIGIPTLCGESVSTIWAPSPRDIRIRSENFYCNWLGVGNVLWDGNFVVDYIDFDRNQIGGKYALGGAGFLAVGGGTGRFLFRFKNRPTLVARAPPGGAPGAVAPEEKPEVAVARRPAPAAPTPEAGTGVRPTVRVRTDMAGRPPAGGPIGAQRNFPTAPRPYVYPRGETRPDDIAVIIGNADYAWQGKDIPDVVPAYADAESFKRYAMQALGVREGNIIFLRDATSAQIVRVFGNKENHKGQLFDWVKPMRSRVVVYYAGHGAPGDREGSAYMVPSDADAARIDLNGYPLSTLYANLSKLPAESVTVVIEACFSGASQAGSVISNASPVFLKAKAPEVPANITVIAAGGANQMASWEEDKSHGLFTKYFLKGMSGEADKKPYGDGDGRVDYGELDAYLKDTLTYYARRYYGRDQTARIVVGKVG